MSIEYRDNSINVAGIRRGCARENNTRDSKCFYGDREQ
jgi:hypothetical protein